MPSKSRWQGAKDFATKARDSAKAVRKRMKKGAKINSIFGLSSNLGQPKVW